MVCWVFMEVDGSLSPVVVDGEDFWEFFDFFIGPGCCVESFHGFGPIKKLILKANIS